MKIKIKELEEQLADKNNQIYRMNSELQRAKDLLEQSKVEI